jgi:NodT family efflux transporter outer membrane factor (OMF) lipoprotein
MPAAWSNAETASARAAEENSEWWKLLRDPAVDQLIDAALVDNPTLAEALARVDQARESLGGRRAARQPQVDATGAIARGRLNLNTNAARPVSAATATISPALSWELDLWGRVRETERAARSRLDARTANARDARLSITAAIANGVLRARACHYALAVRMSDIVSRTNELAMTRQRLSFGNVAPVDVANAQSNLARAETDRISQREQCIREIDALVALSGYDAAAVRAMLPEPLAGEATDTSSAPMAARMTIAGIIAVAPPMRPVLPATVLLTQPSVAAAEREVAARWSEIGVARVERLPQIDLAAVLTGQWIRALGSTTRLTTWSAGPQLSAPVFDGGAGAANVRNAEARYREAVATLRLAVRTAIRDIEDALAAQQSAEQRMTTSRQAVEAAHTTLLANEARWRFGAISMFELQESRRQFNEAQESAIAAARDHALTWVDLVRTSGNAFELAATSAEISANIDSSPPTPLRLPQ